MLNRNPHCVTIGNSITLFSIVCNLFFCCPRSSKWLLFSVFPARHGSQCFLFSLFFFVFSLCSQRYCNSNIPVQLQESLFLPYFSSFFHRGFLPPSIVLSFSRERLTPAYLFPNIPMQLSLSFFLYISLALFLFKKQGTIVSRPSVNSAQ